MDSIASRVRGDFPGLQGIVHLNAASMGAAPRIALDTVAGQLALLDRGPAGGSWSGYIADFESYVDVARADAAKLLGARDDEVGLAQDTTSGLHHAIEAIPFRGDDNVVLSDLEYPQVGLAAANAARDDGVEIRWVKHRAGRLSLDDYRAAIDGRTRALLVSSVGWVTGQRIDLASLSQLADERGVFLVVDAVQQLGGLAIDCSKLRVDFLMAGGYKWLNAPFGVGVLYVRREVHGRGLRLRRLGLLGLEPPSGGWAGYYGRPDMVALPGFGPSQTVRRFEAQGTPNRLGSAGLAASLRYRNGIGGVDRAILDLSGELHEALRGAGATVVTPEAEADRAGIVTFTLDADPAADARLRDFLESRRIYVSVRYCAGVGGVRAAVHYWNDREDVAALVGAVREFRRR